MIHRFGRFEIDTELHEVRLDGQNQAVQRKVVELLVLLASNPNSLVSQQAIEGSIWGSVQVGPSSLRRLVALARRVLGGHGPTIVTVRSLGYRLVVDTAPSLVAVEGGGDSVQTPRSAFVGREGPLKTLRGLLEQVEGGSTHCVLVEGPPGIGKTRLMEVFVEYAVKESACACWGRCSEDVQAPAFWPWRQIFDQLPGPGFPNPDDAPYAETPEAQEYHRFLVFAEIADRLRMISEDRCVVIVIDDLHRADAASLALLNFLVSNVQSMRTLFLCAQRDFDEPSREGRDAAHQALSDASSVCSIPLAGLSGPEIKALWRDWDSSLCEESLPEMTALTAGNPLWISAVLHAGASTHDMDGHIPGLRELLQRKLLSLPATARRLIEVAAIAGRQFDLDLVSRAASLSKAETLAALRDAENTLLVEDASSQGGGGARFRHVSICDEIVRALSLDVRQEIHRRLAESLAQSWGLSPGSRAAELAYHFANSANGARRAIEYFREAASFDRRSLAWENVPDHWAQALVIAERDLPDEARLACELRIELSGAMMRAGRRDEAEASLRRASDQARALDDTCLLARAALAFRPDFFGLEIGGFDRRYVSMLQEALERIKGRDDALHAALLCALAIALAWSDARGRMTTLDAEIEALARRDLDDLSRLYVDCARYALLTDIWERLQLVRSIVDRSAALGEPDLELMHRVQIISDYLEAGDLESCDREIAAFEQQARSLKQARVLWYLDLFAAMRALSRGDLDRAKRHADALTRTGYAAGDRNALQSFGGYVIFISVFENSWESIQGALAGVLSAVNNLSIFRAGRAWAWAATGKAERGRSDYERYASSDFENITRDRLRVACLAMLCEPALHFGDARGAKRLYEELQAHEDLYIQIGFACICIGSASRYLALAAWAMGRFELADAHFEKAVQSNLRADAPLWAALALRDQAKMHVQRAESGVRSRELAARGLQLVSGLAIDSLEKELRLLSRS